MNFNVVKKNPLNFAGTFRYMYILFLRVIGLLLTSLLTVNSEKYKFLARLHAKDVGDFRRLRVIFIIFWLNGSKKKKRRFFTHLDPF